MSRWIDNGLIDRLDMVNRVAEEKNIAPESVEKDWWVTTVLKAIQVSYDISLEKTEKREKNGLALAARVTGCKTCCC